MRLVGMLEELPPLNTLCHSFGCCVDDRLGGVGPKPGGGLEVGTIS